MSIKSLAIGTILCAGPVFAQSDAPLSAIDWLSQPGLQSITTVTPRKNEVMQGVDETEVVVMELDSSDAPSTGLIPAHLSGIPKDFWSDQSLEEIVDLLGDLSQQSLPAGHDLYLRVLLSETEGNADIVVARANALVDRGAVRAAHNLLGQITIETPKVFAAVAETSLLVAEYGTMCSALLGNRKLSDDDAIYVFCLARTGDWDKAVLNFFTLDTLGAFDPKIANLLAADLDPELVDDLQLSNTPPSQMTTLEFRLREIVGHPVPTQMLPIKFAVSDLQMTKGWKSQIDAGERLVRSGSIPASQLIDIYSEGRKSASGGVWERVGAVQDFKSALENGTPAEFETLWQAGSAKGLGTAFANGFATDLNSAVVDDDDLPAKTKMLLLAQQTGIDFEGQLGLIATLSGQALRPEIKQIQTALAADTETVIPLKSAALIRGLMLVSDGVDGDFSALIAALDLFKAMGLQPLAEQMAIQYLVLEKLE